MKPLVMNRRTPANGLRIEPPPPPPPLTAHANGHEVKGPRFQEVPLEVPAEWARFFADGAETPLEKTMRLALEAAGTDEEGFKKLPKREQNAFLAQAAGDQRPEAIAAAVQAQEGFRLIPHARLERSPTNREEFDEAKLVETTESIREHGVIEPLIVRPITYEMRDFTGGKFMLVRVCGDTVTEGLQVNIPTEEVIAELAHATATRPAFEIVAGERRWICAGRAKLAEVPCIVRVLNDRAALMLQLVENLQREDLRPLDEARAYQRMRDAGFTMAEIEKASSKKDATIYAKIALLKLPPEAKEALAQEKISASQAQLVTSIGDESAQRGFLREIMKPRQDWQHGKQIEVKVSFDEAKALADKIKEELKKEADWQEKTADYTTKGYKVLTLKQSEACFNYGSLKAGYVGVNDQCDLDPEGRPWKALLGAHAPTVIVAKASDYGATQGPRLLYARKAAEKALVLAGHKVATAAEKTESKEAARKREEEERKAREAAKLAADAEKIGQVVAAAEAKEINADGWRLIIRELQENAVAEQIIQRRGLALDPKQPEWKRHGLALDAFVAKADGRKLRGLVIELLLWDYDGANDEALAAAAKVYGVKFQTPRKATPARKGAK